MVASILIITGQNNEITIEQMNLNFSALASLFTQVDTHVESTFELDGKSYEIEHFYINFSQGTDHKGKPQHEVKGGQISILLTQSANDNLYDWAMREYKRKDGKILFKSKTEGTVMEVVFTNAFCTSFTRTIDALSGTKTEMIISPEKITVNGYSHDNQWRS